MNEDKTGLKIVLGILGVLAIVVALLRVLAYEPARTPSSATNLQTTTAYGHGSPQGRQHPELLDEFLDTPTHTKGTRSSAQSGEMTVVPQPGSFGRYPQNQVSAKQTYLGPTVGKNGQRYVDTNFYTQDNKQPAAYTAQPSTAYTSGTYIGPQANFNTSAQSRVQEERARMLAPYLRPNRKEKEQMDAKWAKLSAAIDRAVAQALMPKSKKAQMIEKYTAQHKTADVKASGLTGPYAPVASAVSAQKQEIVNSFATSFGSQAAAQAGSLMDNYAQELAGALNMPNATPEQKEQKVKEISQKYQKEMNKLAEKNQYDKFVADRVEKDNKQKADLQAQYPNPELNAKFSQIIDEAREKDLALATQQLPAQEYYKAVYANQYEAHTKLEDAVRQAGESLSALHRLDDETARREIEHLEKLEEEGKIVSAALKSPEKKVEELANTLKKEGDKILAPLSKAFGEQKAQEAEQILVDYRNKMIELEQQELSPSARARLEQDLRANSNRQLLQWWMDQVSAMDIPDEQKQAELEKLRQDYNNIK